MGDHLCEAGRMPLAALRSALGALTPRIVSLWVDVYVLLTGCWKLSQFWSAGCDVWSSYGGPSSTCSGNLGIRLTRKFNNKHSVDWPSGLRHLLYTQRIAGSIPASIISFNFCVL